MSSVPKLRIKKTIAFLLKHHPPPAKILDLGTMNLVSSKMTEMGYKVENTQGEDIDFEYEHLAAKSPDVITAFEILEHLVSPFNLLRSLNKGQKLVATVPLNVWFSKAHWNNSDPWDRHFHEFEPRQFDWLLEKSGWQIIANETWKIPTAGINGIRPILRFFVPTFYAVYAEKSI